MGSLNPLQTAWQQLLQMVKGTIELLPNIIIAIVVFTAFWFVAKFSRRLIKNLTRKKQSRNLGLVLARLSQGFIILIGTFVALAIIIPSFKPGDLVQLLGVSGVAVGFAFRDILQNFLAGILILITEPFTLNDQIIFKEFEGTVENIQTRATIIRTYDGRRIVIPNAELFTNSVTVNTAFDKRRLQYDIGIGYGDDIAEAKKIILEVLHNNTDALQDPPPEALVVDLAGSTINIRARWWINPPRRADAMDTQDAVLTELNNKLVAAGIDLPFPTQQILFHDQTEETDGDRTRQREGWPAAKGNNPEPRRIGNSLQQLAQASSGGGNDRTNHS
ncbi:mechanosensitive ion channel family protein [Waterburya agarophytonicola K14]|uniref:Mechanosensitive ion channel family protein n=1 Tax=Waterburya agarophytonicola KI4 TaxID=2874699 RepID=A0A964BNI5_9CYAN|nr:mechanosensitive ion channel family protein [Waterburya agarophytonicola]MCC0175397.1 mechanosensitive ion channel family protein [Waterburya agarophytonicola KI4]